MKCKDCKWFKEKPGFIQVSSNYIEEWDGRCWYYPPMAHAYSHEFSDGVKTVYKYPTTIFDNYCSKFETRNLEDQLTG